MRCPYCEGEDLKVTDSRDSKGNSIRRRRECLECGERFTTYEYIESPDIYVIKKDGSRELFNREKLRKGIEKACEKRPVSVDRIDDIVQNIETEIRQEGKREIESSQVGERVMDALKDVDKVAYIRFASVYRSFADITCFEEEMKRLLDEGEDDDQEDKEERR